MNGFQWLSHMAQCENIIGTATVEGEKEKGAVNNTPQNCEAACRKRLRGLGLG